MNIKTTFALVLLTAAAGLVWYGAPPEGGPSAAPDDPSVRADDVTKLVIERGKERITLERAGDGWRLAGGWAARPAEVRRLLDALGDLRSRFAPQDAGDFKPAVVVNATMKDGTTRTLGFAEMGDGTSFDRPTLLRQGDAATVTRLAPGLVALLDRPADYYQQRRLFPSKREKKDDGTARAERLDAKAVVVEERGQKSFAVTRTADGWEMNYPLRDALDPRGRDQLLEAVADLWAEKFVEKAPATFEVEKRLTVTRNDGGAMTLEIGPTLPGDGRALARLAGNERVFEVSAAKFGDIWPGRLDALRDGQLARFTPADARAVKLVTAAGTVELTNAAARKPAGGDGPPPPSDWRLGDVKADSAAIDKLLTSLSSLSALERDAGLKAEAGAVVGSLAVSPLAAAVVLDRGKKTLGVDAPTARIEVAIEEGPIGEPKRRTVRVALGKHDPLTKKLFATSGDFPRVNEVSDDLVEQIVGKSALDFRGKKVTELSTIDVKTVRIETRGLPPIGLNALGLSPFEVAASVGEGVAVVKLERGSDGWNLVEPVKTAADAGRADELATRLAGLEALTYVAELGKDIDAATVLRFGLDRPMVRATFNDKVLLVGRPRGDGPGWFARIEGAAQVFTLANETVDLLRRDSLAYRPTQLWTLTDEIVSFGFVRDGQPPFQIVRKGDGWEVTGPFTVAAPREVAEALVKALTAPRAEAYRAHDAKDAAAFGLAKPAVVVTVKTKSGKEQTLKLGRDAEPGRFALAGSAVAVVGDDVAKAADRNALDFLDRTLLSLDPSSIAGFRMTRTGEEFQLTKKDDVWRIVRPTEMAADERKVPELMKLIGSLRAERVAAYAPTDAKLFGLEPPAARIVLEPGKQEIDIGAEVPGTGERFVRVKGHPAVGVVSAVTARRLLASPLAFRDHRLVRGKDADGMTLEAGERKATFGKPEGTWKLMKPLSAEADNDALETFLNDLLTLRADEFVAAKADAAQMKTFGLDRPAARWGLTLDGKPVLELTVGGTEAAGPRRYARLSGSEAVFLLEPKVTAAAVAEYRPRTVIKDLDPAQIEAVRFGHREGAFSLTKTGTEWKVDGKPEVRLDAAKVSDALAALRDLKLERFAVDGGAQLKLFGLDPAELTLEVTTPTGKQTLLLGGQEGGSKRRYGRLPGSKAQDVFVLDEATSGKLFRTLAELTIR